MSDQETTPVSFTLPDLAMCHEIIALCNSRGAFKPEELQMVGALYNKLSAFLQAAMPQSVDATEEQAEQTIETQPTQESEQNV